MTATDTERDLQQLLERRALEVDEHAITGESVRRRLASRPLRRQRRISVVAPLAAAAAVLALIGGVTAAVITDAGNNPAPATSTAPTAVTSPSPEVPQCPSVVQLPDNGNTVCTIGTPPGSPSGSAVILQPETP